MSRLGRVFLYIAVPPNYQADLDEALHNGFPIGLIMQIWFFYSFAYMDDVMAAILAAFQCGTFTVVILL